MIGFAKVDRKSLTYFLNIKDIQEHQMQSKEKLKPVWKNFLKIIDKIFVILRMAAVIKHARKSL